MIDFEKFKHIPSKKEVFTHETSATKTINSLFQDINTEMDRLGQHLYTT
jgi:hypothetical protein